MSELFSKKEALAAARLLLETRTCGNVHEAIEKKLGVLPKALYEISGEELLELVIDFFSMSDEQQDKSLAIISSLDQKTKDELLEPQGSH